LGTTEEISDKMHERLKTQAFWDITQCQEPQLIQGVCVAPFFTIYQAILK